MIKNDQKLLKTIKNDLKQQKMTQNDSRQPKMTINDAKKQSVTDRPTDGPTDRPTDRVGCRVACTRLKIKKQISVSYKHLACVGTPLQTLKGADISHNGFIHKIYPNIFKMRPSTSIFANLLRSYS